MNYFINIGISAAVGVTFFIYLGLIYTGRYTRNLQSWKKTV